MQFKKGLKAVAMAGIAVPERFFSMLKAHGLEVRPIALPDHYDYSKNPFKDCEAGSHLHYGKGRRQMPQARRSEKR